MTPLRRRIYAVVRRIPRGKVATYGQIARLAGKPRAARAVGLALGALEGELLDTVPWQRVVASSGRCSHRDGFWAGVQRDLLEQEGVCFDDTGRIDLAHAGWMRTPPRRHRRRAARTSP